MRTWTLTILASAAVHAVVFAGFMAPHAAPVAVRQAYRVRVVLLEAKAAPEDTDEPADAEPPSAAPAPAPPAPAARPHPHHLTPRPTHAVARPLSPPSAAVSQAPTPPSARSGYGAGFLFARRGTGSAAGAGHRAPSLIRATVATPDYTDDALNAAFEGLLEVDVLVGRHGEVVAANLKNPSGYAIDASVVSAARGARYMPAVDLQGRPMPALAQLKFHFQIP